MDDFIRAFMELSLGGHGVLLDGMGALLLGMAFFLQTPKDIKQTALIAADEAKMTSAATVVSDGRLGTI